jgi:hypothetical protein
MSHVHTCKIVNEEINPSKKYENIYYGTITQHTEMLKTFEQNIIMKEN